MHARTALLVGATGLVGRRVLDCLLADAGAYAHVAVLARRPLGRTEPRLAQHTVDFDQLARDHADVVRGDDVYCCLGTTIRVAGSQAAFRRVDHDYPVEVARLARANGATRFALVSSVGADPAANNFYLRVKGETERDVAALGFASLEIFRPSFLLGEREERRRGEAAGIAVARVVAGALVGRLRQYRPVEAETVARAMIAALARGEDGVHVRTFAEIAALGAAPVV